MIILVEWQIDNHQMQCGDKSQPHLSSIPALWILEDHSKQLRASEMGHYNPKQQRGNSNIKSHKMKQSDFRWRSSHQAIPRSICWDTADHQQAAALNYTRRSPVWLHTVQQKARNLYCKMPSRWLCHLGTLTFENDPPAPIELLVILFSLWILRLSSLSICNLWYSKFKALILESVEVQKYPIIHERAWNFTAVICGVNVILHTPTHSISI